MKHERRQPLIAGILLATALAAEGCTPVAEDVAGQTATGGELAHQEASSEEPLSEGMIGVNGTQLYYRRMGAGDALMVIHGGPVLEHGYLLPHLAPLAEDHELIFADQRLSGRSAGTVEADSVRLATFVDDIEGLRRELGLGRVHLLAHSWGGLLATRYALRYPDNLRSLILVSPMAASSDLWQQEQQALSQHLDPADGEAMRELRESKAFAEEQPAAIERMLLLSFKTQFHDRTRIADLDLFVPDDYMERSRQFGGMMSDISNYDLHGRLGEIEAPTLILYGGDEPGVKLGGAGLAVGIPASRFLTLEDAGHFSFIEQPEKFLEVTREFLSSVATEP